MNHQELILDQFTRQAIPFSSAPAIKDERALRLLLDFTAAKAGDTVLDVACGPGIVVCAFASVVQHATGIDLTPAMIERARILQAEKRLTNVTWQIGDVVPLPYEDNSFSIVTARYAFHHVADPLAVLSEMKRVCRVSGKVVLIDTVASEIESKAEAFNSMERLRDPSHVRALTLTEMHVLFERVALPPPQVTSYKVVAELEQLLARSFPNPGGADEVRRMVVESLTGDGLGVNAHTREGEVIFSYTIAILMAQKLV